MPGSAILGPNLVDDLVPTVDELRSSLHADFGVRQFRVYTVRRTWASGTTGEGTSSDAETEITPRPLVVAKEAQQSLHYDLDRCGVDEVGELILKEVSLTYTEAELAGGDLADGEEWFIKLADGQGQAISDRHWVVAKPPFPDRIKDIGWVVNLERAAG